MTDERLEALGGTRAHALGLGDDDCDLEGDFENWCESMWPAMSAAAGLAATPSGAGAGGGGERPRGPSAGSADELPDLPPFTWTVRATAAPAGASSDHVPFGAAGAGGAGAAALAAAAADMSNRHFFSAVALPVLLNEELRQVPGVGASTRHVRLDLRGSGLSYMTADTLYVLPENEPDVVAGVAAACGFALDDWLALAPAPAPAGAEPPPPLLPSPLSVRALLTRCVDLACEPRKELLGQLAHFASAPAERARLLLLSRHDGRDAHAAWVRGPQRSVAELFAAFPSLRLPLDAFVHIMPRLQPRPYTIASSALAQPAALDIVATVLDAPKPADAGAAGGAGAGSAPAAPPRRLRGLASNTILRGTRALWVACKPSTFRLPRDARTPLIMVGPGTGIAPFVGFLAERAHLRGLGKAVGPATLFFGCQHRDRDYIFRAQLDAWVKDGTLTGLHTAFSREQAAKVYVQHLIAERAADVAAAIADAGAAVYVCGATRMGADVAAALRAALAAHPPAAPMGAAAAAAMLDALREKGRYVQELWS